LVTIVDKLLLRGARPGPDRISQ